MQSPQVVDLEKQIKDAYKKVKCKKVLYFYDESGNKEMLGVFSKRKAVEILKYFKSKKLIDRISEFEVLTTEPDTEFNFS